MSETHGTGGSPTETTGCPEGPGEPEHAAHQDDHRGDHHGDGPHQVFDFEAEREARLAAIKRIAETNRADMRELSREDHSPPRREQKPALVAYAEQAMTMIGDAASNLTSGGRARATYDLVLMLASDFGVSAQTFSSYLARLRQEAPDALAACAKRLLTAGEFFLAPWDDPMHIVLPRLCEVLRFYLAWDMGLQRPAHLVKLEVAVEALGQAKLLVHRATCSPYDLGVMSDEEIALRRKAMESYKLFTRLMDELEVVAGRAARAGFRATVADKAAARPVITEMGPSARVRHRGGRRKDAAAGKA